MKVKLKLKEVQSATQRRVRVVPSQPVLPHHQCHRDRNFSSSCNSIGVEQVMGNCFHSTLAGPGRCPFDSSQVLVRYLPT